MSRPFPKLYNNYYKNFYKNYKQIIKHFTPNPNIQQQINYKTSTFYNYIKLNNNNYYYPNLKTNPILNNKISIKQYTSKNYLYIKPFANFLYNPVFTRHSKNNNNKLFIKKISKLIFIYFLNNSNENRPFLNITSQTINSHNIKNKKKLLKLTFHPNYRHNNKFYIYYSTSLKQHDKLNNNHKIRINKFLISQFNPNITDIKNKKIILKIKQPY